MKNHSDFDEIFIRLGYRPIDVTEADINAIESFVMKMYTKLSKISLTDFRIDMFKGAYIKYVGGGARRFYKFFKKNFVAQETIDLNISWPSNFFRKYFMAPPINFSFLFKAYL